MGTMICQTEKFRTVTYICFKEDQTSKCQIKLLYVLKTAIFKLQMVSYYLENEKFYDDFDDVISQKSKTRKNAFCFYTKE